MKAGRSRGGAHRAGAVAVVTGRSTRSILRCAGWVVQRCRRSIASGSIRKRRSLSSCLRSSARTTGPRRCEPRAVGRRAGRLGAHESARRGRSPSPATDRRRSHGTLDSLPPGRPPPVAAHQRPGITSSRSCSRFRGAIPSSHPRTAGRARVPPAAVVAGVQLSWMRAVRLPQRSSLWRLEDVGCTDPRSRAYRRQIKVAHLAGLRLISLARLHPLARPREMPSASAASSPSTLPGPRLGFIACPELSAFISPRPLKADADVLGRDS